MLLNDGTLAAAGETRALAATLSGTHSGVLTASFSPNPAPGRGVLGFSLPTEGKVSIYLYDIRGRRVHALVDGLRMAAGPHTVDVDRRAAGLPTGIDPTSSRLHRPRRTRAGLPSSSGSVSLVLGTHA